MWQSGSSAASLTTLLATMKNVLFWGNIDFRFVEREQCHDGHRVIHVALWWRHGKHHLCGGLFRFAVNARWPASGWPHLNNIQTQRIFPVGTYMARFNNTWFQHYCDCGHTIVTNNPTPCKDAQNSGKVYSSHFDRAVNYHTIEVLPTERVPLELNSVL